MTRRLPPPYRLLAARARAAPGLVRAAAMQVMPAPPFLPAAARAILVTGVGSSAAHARLLAHLLADLAGLPARALPAGAFVARRADPRDALIVFSQGLSPNARLALDDPAAWLGVMVVTAVTRRSRDPGTCATLARLAAAGGRTVPLPGGTEAGLLLRVAGPLAGYAIAYRLAAAIADAAGCDASALHLDAGRVVAAMRAATAAAARLPGDLLVGELALLASGGYGALADNLALTIGEGLYQPPPPIWDLIDFAHGPFQQLFARRATILALTRRGAAGEADLLRRAARMLDRRRHRLIGLPATLPGAQALFEHQALLNAVLLRTIAARGVDQAHWPGRGRDGALYRIARPPRQSPAAPLAMRSSALADLTWPELAAGLRAGRDTAVVPLGATEQHGPHLPFETDTAIADALADRFCARVPESVRLPALPFGCSAEHDAFPGTVSLRWQTLRALLADILAALARHGFRRLVVFSAHGGNDALLREEAVALRAAGRPAQVIVVHGIERLAQRWHRASAAQGVSRAASGQHAGEFETSILLGLRPTLVRRGAARRGHAGTWNDAHALFYPDLRRNAPSGVVGDPRPAMAPRAAPYLDAWCDTLVAHYRRAKKRTTTNGIQKA
ncbi:MAG TPA: creatininase family protein [Candidatus Dormibacteraeota bacterium]|nr:creatininase family protein [Candidatus Dormibacteraeota bacterium]